MPKFSLDPSSRRDRRAPVAGAATPREGSCDLYAPGHQIHYQHQGRAVRSPSAQVANVIVDGVRLTLVLEDGNELHWHHHDPVRLRRVLDLVPSSRVAYPAFHALRVGPYWFNCATESDDWTSCGLTEAPPRP
jgi:hypothetical protein